MSPEAGGAPIEELLAHTGWIRALARSLVADPQAADDIAQDTMLTALERPPRGRGVESVRGWLARVARNFARQRARGEARRSHRESTAAESVAERGKRETPSAAELASRLDLQRVLTEVVADLTEPNRTVVLLHYYEGLSLVDIARRTKAPAGTIRWRLKRALEQVREAMDARHDGDREAWRAALLPIAGMPIATIADGVAGAGASTGTTAVVGAGGGTGAAVGVGASALGWVASGAAMIVLAATAWFLWKALQPESKHPEAPVVAQVEPSPEFPVGTDEDRIEPRPAIAGPRTAAASDASARERPSDTGRRIGGMLESVAGFFAGGSLPPDQSATIDVRAIDEFGNPIPGVEVALVGYESIVLTGIAESGVQGFTARTDADGAARLELFVPGAVLATVSESMRPTPGEPVELILELRSPRHASERTTVVANDGAVVDAGDVALRPGGTIEGRLVDESGEPIGDAWMSVNADPAPLEDPSWVWRGPGRLDDRKSVRNEADGRFALRGVAVGPHRVWAKLPDELHAQAEVDVVEGESSFVEIVHVDDGTAPRSLTVEVVDRDGAAVEKAHVRIDLRNAAGEIRGARFGSVNDDGRFRSGTAPDDPAETRDVYVHDRAGRLGNALVRDVPAYQSKLRVVLEEGQPMEIVAVGAGGVALDRYTVKLTDATSQHWPLGSRELTGESATIAVPLVPFEVTVEAPHHVPRSLGPFDPLSVDSRIRVQLEALASSRVVVVADGEPVTGAAVEVSRELEGRAVLVNGHVSLLERIGKTGMTDADGVFRFDVDEPSRYSIRVEAAGFAPTDVRERIEPHRGVEDLVIELDAGGSIEGTVRVADGRDPGAHWVTVHRGDGFPRSVRPDAEGRYRFDHLTPGDWRVEITDRSKSDGQSMVMPASSTAIEWNCHVTLGLATRHDIDLRHAEQCELVGRLEVDGRRPSGEWRARLREPGDGPHPILPQGVRSSVVDADGSYRLALDAPRDMMLVLDGPNFALQIPVSLTVGRTRSDVFVSTSRVRGKFEDPAVALDRIWYLEVDVEGVGTATAFVSRSRDGSFTANAPRGAARLVGRKQGGDDLEVPYLVIPSAETFDFGTLRPAPVR